MSYFAWGCFRYFESGPAVWLTRRQQVHLGIGEDQAVGEQLREVAHDPLAGAGMLRAKAFEVAQRDLVGSRRHVGQDVSGATQFQQRHLAEWHPGRQRRKANAVGQGDVDDAAAQEEQRGGGIAGGNDLFAGLIGLDAAKRRQIDQFLVRQSRQQRLFGQFGRFEKIDRPAMAIDHLVFGPFDRGNRTAVPREQIDQWIGEGLIDYLGTSDDVRPSIGQADCIVLPSYREGLPRSLLEGSAMGKPLIATRVPGVRDVVADGETGLLCEVRSARSLADAMLIMRRLPEDARKSMGLAGRRKINEGITVPNPSFQIATFGMPRETLSDDCEPMTNPKLKAMLVTEDVGPIRVSMLRPAVESMRNVFEKIKATDADLYARIATAGALCVRRIRGSQNSVSSHSFGLAVDLNIDGVLDTLGDGRTQLGLTILADFFQAEGWFWGAAFSREDSMHFEVSREMITKWRADGKI